MTDIGIERRKYSITDKKAMVAIIVGILMIITTLLGGIIAINSWKNSVDYKMQDIIQKDLSQDKRILIVEKGQHSSDIVLAEINTNIEFIKKALIRLENKR